MAPCLLVVNHRLLVVSVSRPSLMLTMDLLKPSTPPVVSPGLQSRATTGHIGDVGRPHQHSSNGSDERCAICAFGGASSSGGFLPHLTYPFQHALLLHPSLGRLSGQLGYFYFTQHFCKRKFVHSLGSLPGC